MTNPKKAPIDPIEAAKQTPTEEEENKEQEIPSQIQDGDASAAQTPSEPEEGSDAKYLRLMADFQNYKRRSEKERGEIHAFANEKIVTQLLEVIDNFERALQQESGSDEQYRAGMSLIFEQLKSVLTKSGVEEINALNQEFDPNYHHAIIMETDENIKSGHVSMVLQKGYTLKGKVIRPSIVKVAE
jgi:molecular chaperone GrpE